MRDKTGTSTRPETGRAVEPRGRDWLSVAFLVAAILIPGLFAAQQMSFIRETGDDLHMLGAGICTCGAIIGFILFLSSFRSKGRHRKAAAAAYLAGSIIFAVAAVIIAATPEPVSVPRAGGIDSDIAQ